MTLPPTLQAPKPPAAVSLPRRPELEVGFRPCAIEGEGPRGEKRVLPAVCALPDELREVLRYQGELEAAFRELQVRTEGYRQEVERTFEILNKFLQP
ncbi:MAG: hypothetical protein ACE5JJ_07845 [Nitrospinota bacterium]